MKILAIETSCDETAVCLLEANTERQVFKILGNALYSQASKHAEYGGVYPNLARREHVKNLPFILEIALKEAGELKDESLFESSPELSSQIQEILSREPELTEFILNFSQRYKIPNIDAVAVTQGPGLAPALWVGINFAKALALIWNKPLIATNHMEGHLLSVLYREENPKSEILNPKLLEFPAVGLLISGGHTELILARDFGKYELLGTTRDDAVGEAYDKVARLLNLSYPGGPEIAKLAQAHRAQHPEWEMVWNLPRPMLHTETLDFSFSGLKTAVLYAVKDRELTDEEKESLAREFEEAVSEVLTTKLKKALETTNPKSVIVAGGVAANLYLRNQLRKTCEFCGIPLLLPLPELATDNAVMIAIAASFQYIRKDFTDLHTLKANGNLSVT